MDERSINADTVIPINHENINKEDIEHASKYVEEIQYVPLETNETNIIGDVTKVVFSQKHIYIYDRQTNNLYQFDREGNYIRKIATMGSGPMEYMRIVSFSVDPETEHIAIYCEIKQSIIEFTSEGLPVAEEKIGFVTTDFIHYNDSYLFYGGRMPNETIFKSTYPEQYRLAVMDKNNVKEKYLPFQYNACLLNTPIASDKNCLYPYNGATRLIEKCTGIIYEVNDTISPVYAIDFGRYTIPVDFYANSVNMNDEKIQKIENGNYCCLSSLFETEDYLYIYYSVFHYDRLICSCIYSKKDNKSINIGPLWINDIDNIAMPDMVSTYNNCFIGYYQASELDMMLSTNKNPLSPKMEEMSKTIKDSDNPIICIVKLRTEAS
jgi:hypothetical protein